MINLQTRKNESLMKGPKYIFANQTSQKPRGKARQGEERSLALSLEKVDALFGSFVRFVQSEVNSAAQKKT